MKAFLDGLHRFASQHIDAQSIDREGRLPDSVRRGLAELGVFGLSIPERFGGAGLDLEGTCQIVDALAQHDRAVATTVGLHSGLGTRPLVAYGSEDQQAELLPAMASGDAIAAFATTEPEAGSDLMAIRTTARVDGADLVVSGQKIFVTNAALASVITITASTPVPGSRRGRSLVVLDRDLPGISLGPEERKLGLRGSSTRALFFDDVRVPAGRILGEPGQATPQLGHVLAWGRTVLAAGCNGTARSVLRLAAAHTAERQQFGRPLAALEVVRGQLAEAAARLFAMTALVRRTGQAQDDPTLLERRSIAAKVFCSDGDWSICDTALQLHGGSGYVEDTGPSLHLRDARITRIFEGANDVLLGRLGTLEAMAPPERVALGAAADGLAERIDERRRSLVERCRMRLLRRPRLLHGLGRLAVLREATDAAVAQAEASGTERDRELATHWCAIAASEAAPALEDPPPLDVVDAIVQRLTGVDP